MSVCRWRASGSIGLWYAGSHFNRIHEQLRPCPDPTGRLTVRGNIGASARRCSTGDVVHSVVDARREIDPVGKDHYVRVIRIGITVFRAGNDLGVVHDQAAPIFAALKTRLLLLPVINVSGDCSGVDNLSSHIAGYTNPSYRLNR